VLAVLINAGNWFKQIVLKTLLKISQILMKSCKKSKEMNIHQHLQLRENIMEATKPRFLETEVRKPPT